MTVFDHWCANRHRSTKTVPTVYQQCANRQKQSKDSKNRENDRVLLCCLLTVLFFYNFLMACVRLSLNSSLSASLSLIVIDLPRLYQPCTKSIPKTVKRQSKQQKSPLVYQSSHVYSDSAEYTKPHFQRCACSVLPLMVFISQQLEYLGRTGQRSFNRGRDRTADILGNYLIDSQCTFANLSAIQSADLQPADRTAYLRYEANRQRNVSHDDDRNTAQYT